MSLSDMQTVPSPAEVWSSGDYADVCDRMIPKLGARLVELAEVQAGDRVLDVATGTGNAALPAAAAGAIVTALDITLHSDTGEDAVEAVVGERQRLGVAVSELFGERVRDIAMHREHVELRADSPAGWVDYMATAYGPLVRARAALAARGNWEALRARLAKLANTHGTLDADGFAVRAEYLAAVLSR